MRFVRIGNGKTNIIFLHGWGADKNSFLWLANYLHQYSLHFASLDGFEEEPPPKDSTIQGYSNRLADYIAKNNFKNVVLVGHSFGGRIAIEYASNNHVKGLVLVDSAGIKPKFSIKKWLEIRRYKLLKFLVKTKCIKNDNILGKYGSSDYRNCNQEMKKVFMFAINYNQTKLLKKIDCPTLVYWGKNDKDTPIYMAKKIAKEIKKSQLIFNNGGHFSFLDCPEHFKNCLEYFITNIGDKNE